MHTAAANTVVLATGQTTDIKTNMVQGYDALLTNTGLDSTTTLSTFFKVIGGLIIIVCIGVLILRKWNPQTQMFQGIQQGIGAMGVFVVICGLVLGLLLVAPKPIGDFLVTIAGAFVEFVMNIFGMVFTGKKYQ